MNDRQFHRVAVLMGGPSAEREVSLRSGRAVVKGLLEAGYEAVPVEVPARELHLPEGVEAVFLALHGCYGEDGTVQAQLNRLGIPYTGSGAEASRMAFDKVLTKELLIAHGLPTPEFEVLDTVDGRTLPLPVVVKPPREGSSIGVHSVVADAAWAAAAADVLQHGDRILVERFVEGRELTVGVLNGEALPIVEVTVPGGWYDFTAKYTRGASVYTVPAVLDNTLATCCAETAVRAFRAVGCRGAARVDFRLSDTQVPYVLEINTIPGFTETSLLPMAAAAAGYSFPALCDVIMRHARTDADGGCHGG